MNAPDKKGYTALHYACHLGKVDVVAELLRNGQAEINYQSDKTLYTPLLAACASMSLGCIEMLLKQGSNNNDSLHSNFRGFER